MRELSHRAKNLLSIILAMARQTGRESGSLAEFQDSFAARVQALAAAHDLLVSEGWSGASLRHIVQAQLAPFAHARIEIAGPDVFVAPEAVQNLGLALHELATNATKHGALTVDDGQVRIDWAFHDAGENRSLRLTWTESAGPAVREPARHGFGRTVLERVAIVALGGKGALDFTPGGVVWSCEIDQRFIVDNDTDASAAQARDTAGSAA
jgi:two-component sensor histidine kinase